MSLLPLSSVYVWMWCLHEGVCVCRCGKHLHLCLHMSVRVCASMRVFLRVLARANLSKQVFVIASGRMTFGASLESPVTSCGEDRGREGKELTRKGLAGWISDKLFLKSVVHGRVLLSMLALFQRRPTSYSCACSLTWQLPSTATVFCYTFFHWAASLEPAERVPGSRAHCQDVLREGRVFTHSLYLPRISQLVWEIQNCSLLVTSHFCNL